MGKTYRFALIGCGVISETHAKEIEAIENATLVAVVDPDEEKARTLAVRFGADMYLDYKELLKRDDIDIVNILTPSGTHAAIAMEAALAGKHIITEKPMDVTIEKAKSMIKTCREADVKLAVISQHRFDPSAIEVKNAIDEGNLGNLVLGQAAINWYRSQEYYDSGEWRGTWDLDGGGALMNQGIHTIDLLQYFMGPVVKVEARTATLAHERIEVEDVAVATVTFENGALGTIVGTTSAYPGLSARLEIFGTEGTARIEDDQLTHYFLKSSVEEVNLADTNSSIGGTGAAEPGAILGNSHRMQIEDMIQAIEEDREPLVNGEEGIKPLEIILSIYESAKSKQTGIV